MRIQILVPAVLFGCLYVGVASAKGPHQTSMSRNAQLHTNRAAVSAPATQMRSDTRRTAETVTHRSGTSLDHSSVHRTNHPTHDAGKHKFLPPDVQGEQGMPRVSEASAPAADESPELNDAVVVAGDQAAALAASSGCTARNFRAPATVLRPQVWRRRRGKRDRSGGAESSAGSGWTAGKPTAEKRCGKAAKKASTPRRAGWRHGSTFTDLAAER